MPVPQKGLDSEEYPVGESLKYLDVLGYHRLIVKTDKERALNAGSIAAETLRI